jgi:hypothetical protein
MARGGNAARTVGSMNGMATEFGVLPRARMEGYEIQMVERQRAQHRASWQACAHMVGRSVHDVRLACDPNYAGDELMTRRPVSAPLVALKDLDDTEARVLAMLGTFEDWAAAGQRDRKAVTTTELAMSLGFGANTAGRCLSALEQRGLVHALNNGHGRRMSSLTRRGHKVLEGAARG